MLLTAVQICQKEQAEVRRQRAAISDVLRAIANSPHDLQPIFDTILDSAVHLCRAERGTFRLSEEIGFRLVAQKTIPAVSEMYPPLPANLLEHDSFLGRLLGSKSPVHIPDLATYLERNSVGEAEREAISRGVRTVLIVPMLRNDELNRNAWSCAVAHRALYGERDRTGHGLRRAGCHCPGHHPPREGAARAADGAGTRQSYRNHGTAEFIYRP